MAVVSFTAYDDVYLIRPSVRNVNVRPLTTTFLTVLDCNVERKRVFVFQRQDSVPIKLQLDPRLRLLIKPGDVIHTYIQNVQTNKKRTKKMRQPQ